MYFANRARDLGRCDAVTNTPASHGVRLRHRVDDNGSISHAVELGHRDVCVLSALARIKNVLVDLVSEEKRIELLTEPRNELHLITTKNFSGRIVWIADDDGFRFLIERGSQLVAIEAPVGRSERHVNRTRIGKNRIGRVVLV